MGHRGRGWGPPVFGPGAGGPAGPPPWVLQLLGGAWGHSPGPVRGPRVRRGDVRTGILDVLRGEESLNGYQVIQRITERSRGAWRPSPGSVYPTIAQLEDEGLVETVAEGGRKLLRLTAVGQEYVADHTEELDAVWTPFDDEQPSGTGLKPVIGQLMGAVWQIVTTGSPGQLERAAEILADTRRQLFGLLADGPEEEEA